MPEGVYPNVEATLCLAIAPKSNSAYFEALARIEDEGKVAVPQHLQDANRDGAIGPGLGHGQG